MDLCKYMFLAENSWPSVTTSRQDSSSELSKDELKIISQIEQKFAYSDSVFLLLKANIDLIKILAYFARLRFARKKNGLIICSEYERMGEIFDRFIKPDDHGLRAGSLDFIDISLNSLNASLRFGYVIVIGTADLSEQNKSDILNIRTDELLVAGSKNFVDGAEIVVITVPLFSTCGEASKCAIAAGIRTEREYALRYKDFPGLPSTPRQKYKDFPGWDVFLGKVHSRFFATWQEASKCAIAAGIKTKREYALRYKDFPGLPSTPSQKYKNFPGWDVFLGKVHSRFFATWQEAGDFAIKNGVKDFRSYKILAKKEPRLPSHPERKYGDFPGWPRFFGKVQS